MRPHSGAGPPARAGPRSWPTANGSQALTSTLEVSSSYDGGMKRPYGSGDLGSGGQDEDRPALIELANGATLQTSSSATRPPTVCTVRSGTSP